MALTFNLLLKAHGIAPADVRLLRHVKKSGTGSRSPLLTWREDRDRFEAYQALQPIKDRRYFDAPYWASFIGTPDRETMFVGLYGVRGPVPLPHDLACPMTERLLNAAATERWTTEPVAAFAPYEAMLFVDWGAGTRAWGQYAERREKPIVELRRDADEPEYPGHSVFMRQLSSVEALPASWVAILRNARGVYLLTCPRTCEQYVGSACGEGGFHTRWLQHAAREGDALAFRSRNPADYRVSILEVAGSLASADEIGAMESRWKEKLQTREMGLNRN